MTSTAGWDVAGLDAELNDKLTRSLSEVENRLWDAVKQADALADDVSRHLVQAGGKRVRPLLTLLTSELGSGINDDVVKAAVGVELTHLATLYHDDVMDSAPTRRGAPAAHEIWGNTVAILAGDVLFARASRVVSELGALAVRIQAETFERLCLGQLAETTGPRDGADPIDHYIQVLADKTGSLIATSAHFGSMLAGCDDNTVASLVTYGEEVGVAFQLADDVLDLTSAAQESGKTPGTDLREGVVTMPVLLAREAAKQGDTTAQSVIDAVTADLTTDEALEKAIHALNDAGFIDQTRNLAKEWSVRAASRLHDVPESAVRTSLENFALFVADRST